jgi:GNAT acetyltransferase-like protein
MSVCRMTIEQVNSTNAATLQEWDSFLLNSPRGHYCQLSTWLASFKAYGFDFTLQIARRGGAITGGIGLLKAGSWQFNALVSPIGPIVERDEDAACLIDATLQYARRGGFTLLQLNFPSSPDVSLPFLLPSSSLPVLRASQKGVAFSTGLAPSQMLWLEIPDSPDWRRDLLRHFNSNTKRNIELAEKNPLEVIEARTPQEVEEAFTLFERNGHEQGYSTRAWKDFGPSLIEQVNRAHAVVLLARQNKKALGAHYGVLAGKRYSYMMGATMRTNADLKIGHLLHWRAINKAQELGLIGYDLTSGGSPGVIRFKMGFRPNHIKFVSPQYLVLSPIKYQVFSKVYPHLKRHKQTVSKVLSFVHGL